MKLVSKSISLQELNEISLRIYGSLVKAVVDTENAVMIVDAQVHADQEIVLLESGSKEEHLWGINLYPDKYPAADWIEFDSMINIRPSWGNRIRGIESSVIQEQIREIVSRLVTV